MQSGITASEELLSTFKSFVSDTSLRGFLVSIESEKLVPRETVPSNGSFDEDVGQLDTILKTNEAAYIILRRNTEDETSLISIAYVPDTANVRQKMLFASTRNTLVRELGSEKFAENIFATEKHELTAEGFKKHDEHVKKAAPLTEEERVLGEVKALEAAASSGTQARKSHVSSGVGFPISQEALDALKGLNEGKGTLVQLSIDVEKETINLVSTDNVSASDLSAAISETEPRYSFFLYKHTHNGEEQSPIVFIYTCPSQSKIKERMIYASSRLAVANLAKTEAGLTIEKKLEATSASEFDEKHLYSEFHPQQEETKSFSRPKRPGRR